MQTFKDVDTNSEKLAYKAPRHCTCKFQTISHPKEYFDEKLHLRDSSNKCKHSEKSGLKNGSVNSHHHQSSQRPEPKMDNISTKFKLSSQEVDRIEAFYSNVKSSVFVSASIVEVCVISYFQHNNADWKQERAKTMHTFKDRSANSQRELSNLWKCVARGVALFIVPNSAMTKRDVGGSKQITLIIAERETGFLSYRKNLFHYPNISELSERICLIRCGRIIGTDAEEAKKKKSFINNVFALKFDSRENAQNFFHMFNQVKFAATAKCLEKTQQDNNTASSEKRNLEKNHKKKGSSAVSSKKSLAFQKSTISSPCFFQHITRITPIHNAMHSNATKGIK